MSSTKDVEILDGAEFRWGVSADGDATASNLIKTLPADHYTARAQCRGARFEDAHGNFNHWWVLFEIAGVSGWVSAVWIDEGGNDEPIAGVRKVPTVFEIPEVFGTVALHVVHHGADLRRGGCRSSDPGNLIGRIPGGDAVYRAYAQCAGEYVEEAGQYNHRWVMLDTPSGIGWVSLVDVREGDNGAAIIGVPEVMSWNATPLEVLT